ncbi:MAG: general secretion pathway protein GspB [Steroidobacteraceae bacterium]
MSFILDALRKSENARQRHGGPALAEVPFARRKDGRPWWVWAIAALLGINLIVLLVVLLRSPEPAPVTQVAPQPAAIAQAPVATTPPPTAAPATAPPVQAAAAIPEPLEPATPAKSLADEAASAGSAPPTDPDASALAANVPNRAPIVRPLNPGAAAATNAPGTEENLPTLNELTGDRAVGMPPMHLDIHVYSTKPAERFVFINMRKYTEGATLTEGPVLEKIRTDGVVLNQRGFRFVLPRQ